MDIIEVIKVVEGGIVHVEGFVFSFSFSILQSRNVINDFLHELERR